MKKNEMWKLRYRLTRSVCIGARSDKKADPKDVARVQPRRKPEAPRGK